MVCEFFSRTIFSCVYWHFSVCLVFLFFFCILLVFIDLSYLRRQMTSILGLSKHHLLSVINHFTWCTASFYEWRLSATFTLCHGDSSCCGCASCSCLCYCDTGRVTRSAPASAPAPKKSLLTRRVSHFAARFEGFRIHLDPNLTHFPSSVLFWQIQRSAI